jgi:hypothetical protein
MASSSPAGLNYLLVSLLSLRAGLKVAVTLFAEGPLLMRSILVLAHKPVQGSVFQKGSIQLPCKVAQEAPARSFQCQYTIAAAGTL